MDNLTIRIEQLTKVFKTSVVLDDISVTFQEKKIHGLIGRNGSGKTMLLKCICGFVPPTSGKIYIGDKLLGKDMDMPSNMGIIIEEPGFLSTYSGYYNLKILAMLQNKIGKEEIFYYLKKVGLDPTSKKHVGKYSMGMRQRLGIAQAIMENPDIIILDEPMNGLDNDGVDDIRKVILDLKQEGKTIIIASHNKEDIEILCDEVYAMDKGIIKKMK